MMASMRAAWDSFWMTPVEASRSYVLIRLLLPLLAFDCWIDLLPHGGRYGVGGFNVAHFALLDALPVPSPAIYVGTMILVGWLALVIAIAGPTKSSMGCLTILYTYGWAMSMLDSYQHHYLVSLVLASATFLPTPRAAELFPSPIGREEIRATGLSAFMLSSSYLLFVYLDVIQTESTTGSKVAGAVFVLSLLLVVFYSAPDESAAKEIELLRPSMRYVGVFTAGLLALLVVCVSLATNETFLPRPILCMFAAVSVLLVTWGFQRSVDGYVFDSKSAVPNMAFVSIGVTCAIVYFYTAITKTEPDWSSGAALQRLVGNKLDTVVTTLAGEAPMATGWERMAWGAIAVQLVSCFAYLVAPLQDSTKKVPVLIWLLAIGPLSFHIGVERIGLHIGWFSAYMFAIGLTFFSPAFLVAAVARVLSVPARYVRDTVDGLSITMLVGLASVAVLISLWLSRAIDLPGSFAACICGLLLLCALACLSFRRSDHWHRAKHLSIAALISSCAMFAATTLTDVRFDYYRFVGGDLRRRQDFEGALDAYVKANLYAPEGKDRKKKEVEMRQRVKKMKANQ